MEVQHGRYFTRNNTGLITLRHTPGYELEQRLNLIRVGGRRVKVLSFPYQPLKRGQRQDT